MFGNKAATDGVSRDLNIGCFPGFGGLIQGQIYNPEVRWLALFYPRILFRVPGGDSP